MVKEKNTSVIIFSKSLNHLVYSSSYQHKEICKKLGVSPSTFYNWLNGQRFPRLATMKKIAEFFHVQEVDLLNGSLVEDEGDLKMIKSARKDRSVICPPMPFDVMPDMY
ncbi:MAG: helix-turn-helix domain-containing protein [Lachnospiraceae bacterium]|nr:helix-turn-helix domain-containing protein [Lachnospiraceae bacterium]